MTGAFGKASEKPIRILFISVGMLKNYVTNNVAYKVNGQINNWYTFLIGRPDYKFPSMEWNDGVYENNHYLYKGAFLVGFNNSCIRFNTTLLQAKWQADSSPDYQKLRHRSRCPIA